MFDVNGLLTTCRDDISELQMRYAKSCNPAPLSEIIKDADMFLGLSVGGILKPEMLVSMAANPIVFAMANPEPEIDYNVAINTREDLIMATGRSDYPNQVNNVLGFPYIFRGALDVRARKLMKP